MSRIGKRPIVIPKGVEINQDDHLIKVKGPLGELSLRISHKISVETRDGQIFVAVKSSDRESKSLQGLTRTLIFNMVEGVTKGFQKILDISGVGYRAQIQKDRLLLQVGFSHLVEIKVPEGLEVKVEGNNVIVIKGIDKEKVGNFAAKVKMVKPVEPYKGKGIRYRGERVRRKAGKTGKVGTGK